MPKSLSERIQAANTELIVDGDLEAIERYFQHDYVAHLTDQDMTGGHAAIRKVVKMMRGAFQDLEVEVEILVESEDRVAWQRILRATHAGSFKGFPQTGRAIVWRDMITSQFRDNLIAEEWVISDLAEQLLLTRKK